MICLRTVDLIGGAAAANSTPLKVTTSIHANHQHQRELAVGRDDVVVGIAAQVGGDLSSVTRPDSWRGSRPSRPIAGHAWDGFSYRTA